MASQVEQQILEAQVDFQDVHNFLQGVTTGNITVESYNAANQTSLTQEEFDAAIEELKSDVEIGWTQRLEDVASAANAEWGAWQNDSDTARTFDNDRESPFYERFLRNISVQDIEEFAGMTVEEAREQIEQNGTLF